MKAVILAGGLGTRLKPFTEVIPKPLLPVGERSVLEIQILSLVKHGISEVFIATNYMSEYVRAFLGDGSKYGVPITMSREEKPLGTCGPLSLLADRLSEPFILMNGDILTTLDFSRLYRFAVDVPSNLTVVTKEITTPFNFGRVISEGEYIVSVQEKPDFNLEVLAGIYVMKPEILKWIPQGTYYGMDTLIRDMFVKKEKIARYLMKEYWLDIGRIDDYQVAQDAYKNHFTNLGKKD